MVILDQVYDDNLFNDRNMNTQQIANPKRLFDIMQEFMNTERHGTESGITTITVAIHVDGLTKTKNAIVVFSNAEFNYLLTQGKDIKKWATEWAEQQYASYEHGSLNGSYYYTQDDPQKVEQKHKRKIA